MYVVDKSSDILQKESIFTIGVSGYFFFFIIYIIIKKKRNLKIICIKRNFANNIRFC